MRAADYILGRMNAAGQHLLPAVRQLAAADSPYGKLRPAGSAVLVWHRGQRFILSAAHVVDGCGDCGYFIGTQSSWVEIDGPFRVPVPPPGGRDKDKFDFAFRQVTEDWASKLDGCRFLSAAEIATRDRPRFHSPVRNKYLALGWPQNRFRYDPETRSTTPKNLAYTGAIADRELYERLGLTPETHVVIEFEEKVVLTFRGVQQAPSVKGLSGGGMFRIPALEQYGSAEPPRLAGITIEHQRRHGVIIAVGIDVLLAVIDREYRAP